MTNEELLSVAEIVERLSARFHEHEAKMVEHRAAFGARTEADAKIIAGLREERDGLLTQVQDMRVALAKEQELHAKTALRLSTEAAKLAQSKKGAWVKTTDGRVLSVRGYMVRLSPDREEFYDGSTCTPCDPPAADHDTPEGKQVAESVIRDDRKSEPMCVGDEVEVIGLSVPAPGSGMFTGTIAPIGMRGIAKLIHGTAGFVELDNGTRASIQDVRKVTT